MPFKGIAGEMSEVRRSGGELHLEWKIPRFLDLPCGDLDHYDSPPFGFSHARWYLRVWLNWGSSGRVIPSLLRDDEDGGPATRTVIFSLGLRGSGGGVERRSEEEEWEFGKDDSWPPTGVICERSELLEQKERLMPGDALTVVCVMKVLGTAARGVTNDDEDEADGNASKRRKTSERQTPEGNAEKSIQRALEDFGRLLASGDRSDITVQVGDVEIQVHSLVLFARCPALSVSLRHDATEGTSHRIVVQDCEPDIFGDFLRFLYTGSVQSLTKDNAFALYRIADRYKVDDLKRLCLEHIQNTMSVDTFCDAVRLAMTHVESGLAERANAFATDNIWSILRSEKWQNFTLECPAEANEVLLNLGPPPKRQKSKP